MKKAIIVILVTLFIGCAAKTYTWNSSTVDSISNGMSSEDVVALVGQPDTRSIDSEGIELWQYRKPTESKKGVNIYHSVVSFGQISGANSSYVDILLIKLKNSKVKNVEYVENATNPSQGFSQ